MGRFLCHLVDIDIFLLTKDNIRSGPTLPEIFKCFLDNTTFYFDNIDDLVPYYTSYNTGFFLD